MAVVDHQPLVVDVLAADALCPRGQDDDLGLPGIQAWGTEKASEPMAAALPVGTESALPLCFHPSPQPEPQVYL